jgi:hypothetical protein
MIKVEAQDARGRTVTGRYSLELSNKYFDNKMRAQTIVLRSSMSPRFAERDERGVVRQTFKVWHHEPRPVRIERIVEQTTLRTGEPARERELAPTAVLPAALVPASGLEFELTIDTTREPDVTLRSYKLEGHSQEGLYVDTVISILPPPPVPTAENSVLIDDPAKKARVERALAMLGRQYVTDDELRDLEQQGVFKDLPTWSPLGDWKRTIRPVRARR